jgi:hypothetical protein
MAPGLWPWQWVVRGLASLLALVYGWLWAVQVAWHWPGERFWWVSALGYPSQRTGTPWPGM